MLQAQSYMNMGAMEQKGSEARLNSFFGAYSLSDIVKTTLGPKGMDKILQSQGEGGKGKTIITNDGATILSHILIDNPAAKILVDISKSQDKEVGDGTTTVCVFAGELLRQAESLFQQKIHPLLIIEGFREAKNCALDQLKRIAIEASVDQQEFREQLLKVARTTISSKLLTYEKELFAQLAVEAVLRLRNSQNLDLIQIIKKLGGSLKESFLDEGFLLEKEISFGSQIKKENPKILIANTPMDFDKIKIFGSRVKTDSMQKVAEIEQAEKDKMKNKVEKILAFKPDIFINRQLIYDYPEQLLIEKGVTVIEHADFEGVERLVKALGGQILSTFDEPSEGVLGEAKLMEEVMIGESKLIRFSGCKLNEACSIVLRGSSQHLLDEAERSLHDALCVLSKMVQDKRMILAGGNSEIRMSIAVEELAKNVQGKKAIAIQAYANALKQLPTIIADNGGFDSSELVQNLLFEIRQGHNSLGLNMNDGSLECMKKLGIYESFRVKEQAMISATEAAEMILRVDDIIYCAP